MIALRKPMRLAFVVIIVAWMAALVGLIVMQAAHAQTRTNVQNGVNASSTVAVTNTFQTLFPAALARAGCTIQNNGSNTMYVFFGPLAAATTSNSARIAGGGSINCGMNADIVVSDAISITGTAADTFYAVAW